MMNQLHLTGLRKIVIPEEEDISQCERYLAYIENTKTVDHIHSALAGYKSGLHVDDKKNTHLGIKKYTNPRVIKREV